MPLSASVVDRKDHPATPTRAKPRLRDEATGLSLLNEPLNPSIFFEDIEQHVTYQRAVLVGHRPENRRFHGFDRERVEHAPHGITAIVHIPLVGT